MGTDKELAELLGNISRLRVQHGLSKRRMAELLEIGVASVDKIERGELPPRMDAEVLFRICKQFGVSLDQLLSAGMDARGSVRE